MQSPPPTAWRQFRATRFFGTLDGLRAISILGVIWYHTVPAPRASLLGQGNRGVLLFFAISGFLIVTLLLRMKAAHGTFSLAAFYGRRALRILPVFYAVLAAYGFLVWRFEHDAGARAAFFGNLPAFASFTSNWFVNIDNDRVIFYFAWSLAAEEQFYLVWPVLERLGRGMRPLFWALFGLVTIEGIVLAAGGAAVRGNLILRILTSPPAAILLGVIVAHLLHYPSTFGLVWQLAGRRGSAAAAAVLTVLVLAASPRLGDARELAISLAVAFLVCTCVIREDNDLAVLLRCRAITWIGMVSYGMYLMHMIAVNLVRRAGAMAGIASPYFDFVAGALLAFVFASVSFMTYERFFLSLKDRWFGAAKAPARKGEGLATASIVPPAQAPTAPAPP